MSLPWWKSRKAVDTVQTVSEILEIACLALLVTFETLSYIITSWETVFKHWSTGSLGGLVIAELIRLTYARRKESLDDLEKDELIRGIASERTERERINEQIVEAKNVTEHERLTRIKLGRSLGPRTVTTVITNNPNEGLRLFSETKVAIQFIAEDEPQCLASDIIALLKASEWNILGIESVNPGQTPQQFTPPQFAALRPTGVYLLTTYKLYGEAPWEVASYRAANVLKAHLKEYDDLEIEIETPTSGPAWPPNLADDAVLIRIGAIPQSYFEELAMERIKKIWAKRTPADIQKRMDEFEEWNQRVDRESEERHRQEVHKIIEEQKRLRSGLDPTPESD